MKKTQAVPIAFLLLAWAYQKTVPLFETPDETSHMEYAAHVAEGGGLPRYGENPEVPGEGIQPPLFYFLAAPLYRAWAPQTARAELHNANLTLYRYDPPAITKNGLLRLADIDPDKPLKRLFHPDQSLEGMRNVRSLSLAFGLFAVVLTGWALTRALGPDAGLLGAAIFGLNPQFLFLCSSVSNDAAAAAVGAGFLALLAAALPKPAPKHFYVWAALAAAGFYTKNSTLPTAATALGALTWARRAEQAQGAGRFERFSIAKSLLGSAGLFFLLAGPLLIFNAAHRGGILGMEAVGLSAQRLPGPEAFGGVENYLLCVYPAMTFESYWGRFGWMTVRVPALWTLAAAALTLAGLGGLLRAKPRGAWFTYCAATCGAMLAGHLWLNLTFAAAQGRHLFPAAPHLAGLLASGLLGWKAAAPNKTAWTGVALMALWAAAGLVVITTAYR